MRFNAFSTERPRHNKIISIYNHFLLDIVARTHTFSKQEKRKAGEDATFETTAVDEGDDAFQDY